MRHPGRILKRGTVGQDQIFRLNSAPSWNTEMMVLQQLYIIYQDYELPCGLSRNSHFFWNSRRPKVQEFPLVVESLPARWEVAGTHHRGTDPGCSHSWELLLPREHWRWWVPLSVTDFFLLSIIDLQNYSRVRYTTMIKFLYISEWSPQ